MINLSLSQKFTSITHESDKESRGTSYFFGATNTFQARLLTRDDRNTNAIHHLFHVVFDHDESWTSDRMFQASNYVARSTAKNQTASAKANFQNKALCFQRACEQTGLTPFQREIETNDGYRRTSETKIFTLIHEDIDRTLTCLCENSTGELQSWLNSLKASLHAKGNHHKIERIHNGQHIQEFCDRCLSLGRQCTIRMEPSRSPNHPNDVVLKSLPTDISSEQFRQLANVYGNVLRSQIMPTNSNYSYRMGFVTYQDRQSALQKFNQ
ncbi:MAG TPA: RNA-binding protein [Chlamydiales bacterium]|nr:RNA-binding protein [Chlamydiales bacterium]